MRITFLGSASSLGVPMLGCDCEVCRSADERDRRRRCALLVEYGGKRLLVDAGPDIRAQLLEQGVSEIEAVLVTHQHSDHVMGLDELRPVRWRRPRGWRLPLLAHAETMGYLRSVFPWFFEELDRGPGYLKVDARECALEQELELGEFAVMPLEVDHGSVRTVGWRIRAGGKSIGYFSDMKCFCESSLAYVRDLDVLVMDCLRDEEHGNHQDTAAALAMAAELGAELTVMTHFSHEQSHAGMLERFPPAVIPAYDGLQLCLGEG